MTTVVFMGGPVLLFVWLFPFVLFGGSCGPMMGDVFWFVCCCGVFRGVLLFG